MKKELRKKKNKYLKFWEPTKWRSMSKLFKLNNCSFDVSIFYH